MARPTSLATNWPTVSRFTGQAGLTGLQNTLPNGWFIPQVWTGLVMELFWENSILAKICNTDIEEPIKRGGGEAIIRQRPPITINDWIVNQDLQFSPLADTAITIPIKYAKYAAAQLDSVDIAQMDLDLMQIVAEDMNNQHMETETNVVIQALTAQLIANLNTATAGVNYGVENIVAPGADPVNRYKGTVYLNTSASTPTRYNSSNFTPDPNYIVRQITHARTILNRKRVPMAGRFLIVPPIVEDMLILSDQATWNVSGKVDKVVEEGEYGLRVAGFDIIVSNFITQTTFDAGVGAGGQADAGNWTGYPCLMGLKKGYAFARQITEVDIGFDMAFKTFGKGLKTLNVFGAGISNWSASGILGLIAS